MLTRLNAPMAILIFVTFAGMAGCTCPATIITVTAAYPGASADVIADTVAAPIEQQINGVEKMALLSSRSENGVYTATVFFNSGADPALSLTLVQNRVALALPILPDAVTKAGVSIRITSPGVLKFAVLTSPNRRFDAAYLSNYAKIHLHDELARVAGVSEVLSFGNQDQVARITIDSKKLAARHLAVSDVIATLRKSAALFKSHQVEKRTSEKGKPFQITMTLGPLWGLDDIMEKTVLTDGQGKNVPLKDIAKGEPSRAPTGGQAILNGQPAYCFALCPMPGSAASDREAGLKKTFGAIAARLPDGIRLHLFGADHGNHVESDKRIASQYLALDVEMPRQSSRERLRAVLMRCDTLLRGIKGVRDVLALTESPFSLSPGRPVILVRLGAEAESRKLALSIEESVKRIDGARIRALPVVSRNGVLNADYPLAAALQGPEIDKTAIWARKLMAKVTKNDKRVDASIDSACLPSPSKSIEFDGDKLRAHGISMSEAVATMHAVTGLTANGIPALGSWQVALQMKDAPSKFPDNLKQVTVRTREGKIQPLAPFVHIRESIAPQVIYRLDMYQSIGISAWPAPGMSVADAKVRLAKLADEVRTELMLPAEYRLIWLGRPDVDGAKAAR